MTKFIVTFLVIAGFIYFAVPVPYSVEFFSFCCFAGFTFSCLGVIIDDTFGGKS